MDKKLKPIEDKLKQILVVLIDNNRSLINLNEQLGSFLSVLEIKSYEEDKIEGDIEENSEDPWKTDSDPE